MKRWPRRGTPAKVWTYDEALAYASTEETDEAIHSEDLTVDPEKGETRVFFSRAHGLAETGGCPWCVLGTCWQRVTHYGPADRALVVHGRRVT